MSQAPVGEIKYCGGGTITSEAPMIVARFKEPTRAASRTFYRLEKVLDKKLVSECQDDGTLSVGVNSVVGGPQRIVMVCRYDGVFEVLFISELGRITTVPINLFRQAEVDGLKEIIQTVLFSRPMRMSLVTELEPLGAGAPTMKEFAEALADGRAEVEFTDRLIINENALDKVNLN